MLSKKALFISGGSTKISFMAGAAINLIKNGVVYRDFVGISSGAILSLTLALGKIQETEDFILNYSQKDIFKQTPNSFLGTVFAFFRVITGKSYVFDQSKLVDTIKKVVSQRDFDRWKSNSATPNCHVGAVDISTGDIKYYNLRFVEYEEALKLVLASCSIPVFTKPVEIFDKELVDGGNRDHIGSSNFLDSTEAKNYDQITSIFSRPIGSKHLEAWKTPKHSKIGLVSFWIWLLMYITPEMIPGEDFISLAFLYICLKQINIQKILTRSINIFNLETSINDEIIADYICKEKGIDQIKIFAPEKLTSKTYEITPELSKKWFEMGRNESCLIFENYYNAK